MEVQLSSAMGGRGKDLTGSLATGVKKGRELFRV